MENRKQLGIHDLPTSEGSRIASPFFGFQHYRAESMGFSRRQYRLEADVAGIPLDGASGRTYSRDRRDIHPVSRPSVDAGPWHKEQGDDLAGRSRRVL